MPTRPNEFHAYFTLVGDFDPDNVTAMIGMKPSESWKGDINERTRIERKFSRWSVDSRLDVSKPLVEHIRDVLTQLQPQFQQVRAARASLKGYMQAVAYFYSESPWFHFDEDVVSGCAALHLGIDCDFYTMYSDRREDSE